MHFKTRLKSLFSHKHSSLLVLGTEKKFFVFSTRDPKLLGLNLSGDVNKNSPFLTPAVETFNLEEFRTPGNGKWDYKKAFIQFIEEHTEAAIPVPTLSTPEFTTLAPVVPPELVPILHYFVSSSTAVRRNKLERWLLASFSG